MATLNDRLVTAVRRGKFKDVVFLLENGADPRYRDKTADELTVVHNAVRYNRPECLRALLMFKGKHNLRVGATSTSPLNMAAQLGFVDCCRVLLAAGSDPNSVDALQCTPLMFAAEKGYSEIAYDLLWAGADPSRRDRNGWTPLLLACHLGHDTVAKHLLSVGKANTEVADEHGRTPLMISCLKEDGTDYRHGNCVQYLLKAGASVYPRDRNGWNVLHYIMRHGCQMAARHILFGVHNALDQAEIGEEAEGGKSETLPMCAVDKGSFLDATEPKEGRTPLHVGAVHGRTRSHALAFKLLLRAGASYHSHDRRGKTPLVLAKAHGSSAIVRQLVSEMRRNGDEGGEEYAEREGEGKHDYEKLEQMYDAAIAQVEEWKATAHQHACTTQDVRTEWELDRQQLLQQIVKLKGSLCPESSDESSSDENEGDDIGRVSPERKQ